MMYKLGQYDYEDAATQLHHNTYITHFNFISISTWFSGQVVRKPDLRSTDLSRPPCFRVQPWASCYTHASVTKQYNLVPANGQWCSVAVEATARLAESNGSLLPGLWLQTSAGWLPRTGISYAHFEYETTSICPHIASSLSLPIHTKYSSHPISSLLIQAVREATTNMPPPLWPWSSTFWPWKWCPNHVWCGLPLC